MLQRLFGVFTRGTALLATRPMTSFFIMIGLLFGIIALSHALRTPQTNDSPSTPTAKSTAFFDITHTAFVTVPAKVTKENIVNIVALTPGIVTAIFTAPGRPVGAGQTILTLTNDYQSGDSDLKKRLANENARLTAELSALDKQITRLEEKQTKRDDSLSGTAEDIALLRLQKERATRKSTLTQSTLSTGLANVGDAILKPKTFTEGITQSIRVKRGDLVATGQVLATIKTRSGATTIEAQLDFDTAQLFDPTKEARLVVDSETISLLPTAFAQSENDNGLFSVLYTLSDTTARKITNGAYLTVSIPLRHPNPATTLIPIDAIYQDENSTSLLLERDGMAVSQLVTIGKLYGSYAEVFSGLNATDRVILSRSVIAGDRIVATE